MSNEAVARGENSCTCADCARRRARVVRQRYLEAAHKRSLQQQMSSSTSASVRAGPNRQLAKRVRRDVSCSCQKCQARRLTALTARNEYERMLARLQQDNLVLHQVDGDGNCQFRAFAHFANNSELDHARLRCDIVDFIEQNPDRFELDIRFGGDVVNENMIVRDYCDHMRQLGVWGDGVTLMAFCLRYNVNVRLYSADGWSDIFPCDTDEQANKNRPTVCMARCGAHYDATDKIVPKKSGSTDSAAR